MLKNINKKLKRNNGRSAQAGMSILELMVVMGIYAVISAVVIFSYPKFQAKVDIENLASDIALQVVTAQNAALNGLLPLSTQNHSASWKPTYGVYFSAPT